MKLKFEDIERRHPDPYIFKDGGRYYIYATGGKGAYAYSSDNLEGPYKFEGSVFSKAGHRSYWAPSVFKKDGKYYIYVSCEEAVEQRTYKQYMHVAVADNPLGPFVNEKMLYNYFSIDSHVVETEDGMFLWFACDVNEPGMDKPGTRIFIDRLLDPFTVEGKPKEVLTPSFPEERSKIPEVDGRVWYTLEGPFWFSEGDWQYLMYSGACYENDSYHLNYAAAKTNEQDLTKVEYIKASDNGKFVPLLYKNDVEEGTGHHSVIKEDGQYYIIYHGRDIDAPKTGEQRTARIARLIVNDGVLTVERM